jgi:hypothetical protein
VASFCARALGGVVWQVLAGLGGEETIAGAEFFAGIGNCREFSGIEGIEDLRSRWE